MLEKSTASSIGSRSISTLVKKLEELGIGRPSTYAAIVSRIIDQGYVWKRGSALVPHFLAFTVTRLMEETFTQLVDYDFTASLEEVLDESRSKSKSDTEK